jgi:acyl transferase domain-containing protein
MTILVEPIAVVGQGAVLPGALSADALWLAVSEGRDLLTDVPEGAWPIPPQRIAQLAAGGAREAPFHGGFVQGFDAVFNERLPAPVRRAPRTRAAGASVLDLGRG